jgi:hypothetical protein
MSNAHISLLILVPLAFLAAGLIAVILMRLRRRAVTFKEGFVPISDWRPTGCIDFITLEAPNDGNDPPPTFLLRTEDYRMLESMAVSGAKQVEFRWRNATLLEAKHVVSAFNASRMTIDDYLPRIIRNPHIVPDQPDTLEKPVIELAKPPAAPDGSDRAAGIDAMASGRP